MINAAHNDRNRVLERPDLDAILQRYIRPGLDYDDSRVDLQLFRHALTHRSLCARTRKESNERLEFLGDAVLGLAAAAYLFKRYPDQNEGFLTRLRGKLVSGRVLADLVRRGTDLGRFVLLSKKTEAAGYGRDRTNVLEDALEAFLAALFLSCGFEAAQKWAVGLMEENLDFAQLVSHQNSPKDVLNRFIHAQHGFVPTYGEVATSVAGSDAVVVAVRDREMRVIATGSGANRKAAENAAALNALAYYQVPQGSSCGG